MTGGARTCLRGQPWPLGAAPMEWQGQQGVNLAVFSRHATAVHWCLFDADGNETQRVPLVARTDGIWHGFLPGLEVGQLYGLRAEGPWQPEAGHRFNAAKLLIDPYARELVGSTAELSREVAGQEQPDPHDNADRIPKARVIGLQRELAAGAAVSPAPPIPREQVVIYEAHVKGLTRLHPGVPENLRGHYAGLASAAMLAHYRKLGITTLCLLPVQQHIDEKHLLDAGLANYWGYNTLGFFIPDPRYATDAVDPQAVRDEFRAMVSELHRHGIEVVLDVVYNHTAEGGAGGPTLSWRGLDNASSYALDGAGNYLDFTGCGNSVNMGEPRMVQFAGVRKALDAAKHPALLFVDGVSSVGSLDMRMGEWGVDACVSGSQKGFMLPTGLGILAVSQKALDANKSLNGRMNRCFFAWEDMIKTNDQGYRLVMDIPLSDSRVSRSDLIVMEPETQVGT